MKRFYALLFALSLLPASSEAAIHTESVLYEQGGKTLEGYLAYDDAAEGRLPGVLVVHDWMGLRSSTKKRAEALAALGYVAFAADIYGKDARPADQKEAGAAAGIYKSDRKLMRERAAAGLEVLKKQDKTDSSRTAAIGYCFGGMAVLELARSGADVQGVVSFHGGLDTPDLNGAKNIKAKVLVLHGADDPFAPAEHVTALDDELRQAGADYQIHLYGGAVHSFTEPEAGNDPSKGAAYNESADKRSWEAMKQFFAEIF